MRCDHCGLRDAVINLTQVPLQGWNSLVKRVVDIALSAAGLLLLAPFLPLLALAIWLEDRGPIFYSQERMGLDGRSFQIWKFRSMRVDAEQSSGPVWAVEVKWSDRAAKRPAAIDRAVQFCARNNIGSLTVTTRRVRGRDRISNVSIELMPAALYCFAVGHGIVEGTIERAQLSLFD